jgi:hypothetical protein
MKYVGTSPVTGTFTIPYTWTYCHSYYKEQAGALYISDGTQTQFITPSPDSPNCQCGCVNTGTIDIAVESGKDWGFFLEAGNYDGTRRNQGTFKLALSS